MPQGLHLKIGADVQDATTALKAVVIGLAETGKGFTLLQKQVVAFGGGVKSFSSNLNSLTTPLKVLPKATDAVVVSMKRLPAVTNAATQSMINLGRVVQDAPFGFLGIANNLNPLLESFQRLRATTGSTGLALKALGSSLLGAGGIGFGLSIVSSLLLVFGTNLFGAGKKAKEAKEPINEIAEAQKKLKQDLESASKSVVSQAADFESLKRILIDVSNEYLVLGDAITKQGIAQFLFSKKQGLVEDLLTKQIQTQLKVQKELNSAKEFVPKSTAPLKALRLPTEQDEKNLRKLGIGLHPLEKQIFDINILAESLGLSFKRFVKTGTSGAKDIAFEYDALGHIFEKLLSIQALFSNQLKTNLERIHKVSANIQLDTLSTNFPDLAKQISTDLQKRVEQLTQNNPILLLANAQLQLGIEADKQIKQTLDAINKTIQQTAVNAFSGLGESLGAALVGGDLKDGFRAFANIIAEGFSAIGKQMIAAAPIIAALKAAIKSLNPAILLPAGLALVAIGAALRGSIGKGITGFAGGGLVSGPTLGMIGEGAGTSRSNPEVIAPLDKLKSILADLNVGNQRVQVAVTGRLRGRDMALQNARTSRTNRRLGA